MSARGPKRWASVCDSFGSNAEAVKTASERRRHCPENWVSVAGAVAAAYERSGDGPIPDFRPEGVTYTEKGFFNEASVEVSIGGQSMKSHQIQLVEARDGKAVRVKEYIGPEMGVQP